MPAGSSYDVIEELVTWSRALSLDFTNRHSDMLALTLAHVWIDLTTTELWV